MRPQKKALLVGVGFDHKDKHVRITKGDNFALLGGSEKTHASMQEKAMSFNEQLDKRRKKLEDISREEFEDIAQDIGLIKN
ncbi:MAG: hypothetical protein HYS07_05250 [Chlamydiae bacterium]|nr:hypothetical protein [Chlamydiota bacterium]MBI3277993.1 hypothetical protein [Chlamydiota bacterium]